MGENSSKPQDPIDMNSPKPLTPHKERSDMSSLETKLTQECHEILKGTELEKINSIIVKLSEDYKRHLVEFLKAEKNKNLTPEQLHHNVTHKIHELDKLNRRKRKF